MHIFTLRILHGNIDQTLVNYLHGLLSYELGRLYYRVIIIKYITCVRCVYMLNIDCNALVHVIHSRVSR